MNVVALACEDAVRANLDLDQCVAGRTAADARPSLATQTQDLAIASAGRNGDVEHGAVGQGELLLAAVDRIEKIKRQAIVRVLSSHADIAARLPTENFRKEIVAAGEVGKSGIACVRVGCTGVGEIAVVSLTRPLGTGRIDLAAVETRALLRIAQQVVGGGNLLELLLGLLISGIQISAEFFRQPPL